MFTISFAELAGKLKRDGLSERNTQSFSFLYLALVFLHNPRFIGFFDCRHTLGRCRVNTRDNRG